MRSLMNWGWAVLYALALAVVVWVSASGGGQTLEETAAEKTTLTFRHFWTKEHDSPLLLIFEDVVKSFERDHPHVKINFEGMDQTIHREQRLKSEMVTGNPPDLFVLFGGAEIEPYVRSERLMDLTGFAVQEGLDGQFQDLSLWIFDGGIYGLPIEGNAEPVFYNRTIFAELGITPPSTIGEMSAAIAKLRGSGYIPIALGNAERWPGAIAAHYLMDRYAGPAQIEAIAAGAPGASFDNPEYEAAYGQLQAWALAGAFPEAPSGLSTEEAIALFTQGRAAMYINGNWDITLFTGDQAPPGFDDQVDVMPFPSLHPGGSRSVAGGYTFGIGMAAHLSGAQRQAAYELLRSFYTEEVQRRIVYEGLRIPSMRIGYDPEKTGPVFAQVIELMESTPSSFVPYDNILSPEVKKSFLRGVEQMIDGTETPQGALRQLQDASEQYWRLRRSSEAAEHRGEDGNGVE